MTLKNLCKGRETERGNVLFLILIAVALFAALSYAVTQSTRSGGGDASGETSLIGGAQITQYPASVRTSLVRMIIGGMDVELLEFNIPSDFDNCYDDGAGNQARCVFHPTGGGATYVTSSPDVMEDGANGTWTFNGDNEINLVGTSAPGDTVTANTADIIAFLEGISPSVCKKINEELGITAKLSAEDVPVESGIVLTGDSMINDNGTTDSTIAAGGATIGGPTGTEADALDGQPFGCFEQPAGTYVYYHVLIER